MNCCRLLPSPAFQKASEDERVGRGRFPGNRGDVWQPDVDQRVAGWLPRPRSSVSRQSLPRRPGQLRQPPLLASARGLHGLRRCRGRGRRAWGARGGWAGFLQLRQLVHQRAPLQGAQRAQVAGAAGPVAAQPHEPPLACLQLPLLVLPLQLLEPRDALEGVVVEPLEDALRPQQRLQADALHERGDLRGQALLLDLLHQVPELHLQLLQHDLEALVLVPEADDVLARELRLRALVDAVHAALQLLAELLRLLLQGRVPCLQLHERALELPDLALRLRELLAQRGVRGPLALQLRTQRCVLCLQPLAAGPQLRLDLAEPGDELVGLAAALLGLGQPGPRLLQLLPEPLQLALQGRDHGLQLSHALLQAPDLLLQLIALGLRRVGPALSRVGARLELLLPGLRLLQLGAELPDLGQARGVPGRVGLRRRRLRGRLRSLHGLRELLHQRGRRGAVLDLAHLLEHEAEDELLGLVVQVGQGLVELDLLQPRVGGVAAAGLEVADVPHGRQVAGVELLPQLLHLLQQVPPVILQQRLLG
mmetsp:Transcript_42176/g.133885  ORF Transcript_42176/g.133885 Transcript_42176/m.133885 type:complete len:535 (+) Transcript_42176:18-1622(+)